ncbi:replicative DNA helicase [Brevundimonas sp. TWP3-1-2b1]|uniref:replicative DNA helicase n=1 Tax=Brevundimonas sp. TWP3-1-2b1 TaxID=2804650 RepID=UPI003CF511DA
MTGFALQRPAPPRNLEAEQALLGCLMMSGDVLDAVDGLVSAETFSEPYHQLVFGELATMIRSGRRPDPTLVMDSLKLSPAFEEFGGLRYLADLMDRSPPVHTARDYGVSLADLATRRALIESADIAAFNAADPGIEGLDHVAALEARLADIASVGGARDEWEQAGEMVGRAIDAAQQRDGVIRFSWGIAELDDLTGGLQAGEVAIVAGRPGMLKTGVAISIALANAAKGFGTAFNSLEMSGAALGLRVACAVAHDRSEETFSGQPGPDGNPWYISASKGTLTRRQWERLREAQAAVASMPLLIDARAGLTVARIEAAARRAHRKWRKKGIEPGPVIVDHLGIVRPDKDRKGSRHAEVADVSRGLAEMAKRLGVPVVALCQLNRGVEGRDDKRPQLSDLRQAGEIEEDARAVVMLYRASYYLRPPMDPSREGPAEAAEREAKLARAKGKLTFLVEKNSHGPAGVQVEAFCDPATSAVGDLMIGGARG